MKLAMKHSKEIIGNIGKRSSLKPFGQTKKMMSEITITAIATKRYVLS
ncbi:MAG: hypothetical protein V1909_05970 [Candidatus Micrarchaeota archaeon]